MFSGTKDPTVLLGILSDVTGSQKSKMAASNLQIRISRLVDMIATKFQRYPHVLGARCPTILLGILSDVTGSQKSKMAASNQEIRISRLVDMIATTSQRLSPCFRGQGSNPTELLEILSDVTGSQKSKMMASNLEIRISRHLDMIATTF